MRKPSAEILQQIAKALRISAETLYVRAGILEDERRDDDVVRHILMDPYLVEEQRQALVRIYLSFRRENGLGPRPERGTSHGPDGETFLIRLDPMRKLAVLSMHTSPVGPARYGGRRRDERLRP